MYHTIIVNKIRGVGSKMNIWSELGRGGGGGGGCAVSYGPYKIIHAVYLLRGDSMIMQQSYVLLLLLLLFFFLI